MYHEKELPVVPRGKWGGSRMGVRGEGTQLCLLNPVIYFYAAVAGEIL